MAENEHLKAAAEMVDLAWRRCDTGNVDRATLAMQAAQAHALIAIAQELAGIRAVLQQGAPDGK